MRNLRSITDAGLEAVTAILMKIPALRTRYVSQQFVPELFQYENLREKDHLKNPVVNGRIILRWIFET